MIREYGKLNKPLSNNSVDQPIEPLTQKPDVVRTSESNGVRKQRFAELKILQAEGHSIKGIAGRLGMHRQTVKKYMEMQALSRRSHGERKMLEQYFPYINRRMEEAPALYLKTLWNELKQLGYQGAYTTLSEALIYYDIRIGKKASKSKFPQRTGSFFKPSQAAMLFIAAKDKLGRIQLKMIDDLRSKSDELRTTYALAEAFRQMMTNKLGDQLKHWIDRARASGIREMAAFATGLLTDYQAIRNAMSLHWSNGPVEGNVNKLKTIKRQMYGRAGFDLLKKRLVLAPS